MAKRRGEHEEAARFWEGLARDPDWRAAACEELSLFYERRRKDLKTALHYARQGMAVAREKSSRHGYARPSAMAMRRSARLTKRAARLAERLKKTEATPLLGAAHGTLISVRRAG